MRRQGRQEGWAQEILHKLCLTPTEFAKKYNIASCIFFWKENVTVSAKTMLQRAKVSRKLIKQCCMQGT